MLWIADVWELSLVLKVCEEQQGARSWKVMEGLFDGDS